MGMLSPYIHRFFTNVLSSRRQGLAAALGDPIEGLYTTNSSEPLQQQAGLRDFYDFGLYSYCAYVSGGGGVCSNHTTANEFRPYDAITADMLANYSGLTNALIPSTTFTDSSYLGDFSHGAYYTILIGTICAALALILYADSHTSISRCSAQLIFSTADFSNIR